MQLILHDSFCEKPSPSHLARIDSLLHESCRLCIVAVMPKGSRLRPDEEFTDALTQVIRAKLGMLNLTIADLARSADIPRPTMSRIVNGHKNADVEQLRRIARGLGMSLAGLVTAADRMMEGNDPFGGPKSGPS